MPRGARDGPKPAAVLKAQRGAKKGTQKGRTRHFTSPEELAADAARLEEERNHPDRARDPREGAGDASSSSEEESGSGSESDAEVEKAKGVQGLIEVENPNRVVAKSKKISDLTLDNPNVAAAPAQLTRRERDEIEKERQKKVHEQLRAEGKTDQARADLARLAIIRQEREQAAKRREAETKVKEAARAAKVETTPSMKKDDPGVGVGDAVKDKSTGKK